MKSYGTELLVRKIKRGTVIDHIPAGRSLDVLRILGITGKENIRVAVVMNVESKRLGKKDIVKIEDRILSWDEVNLISLIAPTATINIIEDYMVKEKRRVEIPMYIKGLIKCRNPTCISNLPREPIQTVFTLISKKPLKLRCEYCGTYHKEEDILESFRS